MMPDGGRLPRVGLLLCLASVLFIGCGESSDARDPAPAEITSDAVPARCMDADDDGWANGADIEDCPGEFQLLGAGDCDDTDALTHPGAREVQCDGIDQSCSSADQCSICDITNPVQEILSGIDLDPSFDATVRSSHGEQQWLTTDSTSLRMDYPSGQTWGAVSFAVGSAVTSDEVPSLDFSECELLSVEMRATEPGQRVTIGVQDHAPDHGVSRMTIETPLAMDWRRYLYDLEEFSTTDPASLHVVMEFAFTGEHAQTVHFRNVRYERGRGESPQFRDTRTD